MSYEALVNDGLFWFVVPLTPLLMIFLCAVIAMPSECRPAQIIQFGALPPPSTEQALAYRSADLRAFSPTIPLTHGDTVQPT
jgi:hypothetical protein